MIPKGLLVAAPSSGSGKTTVTLGLLRALHDREIDVVSAKSGPDYIDPQFHKAATHGQSCPNLDAWAMPPERIKSLVPPGELLIVEGAMGLFDGAPPDNRGSAAALAKTLRIPVILVIDAARMSGSVAPLVTGFAEHDPNVTVCGVIVNNVGSARHERMLRGALQSADPPVLGAIPRTPSLHLPSRHLGLVQATELQELEAFIAKAASIVAENVDLKRLQACASVVCADPIPALRAKPPAQRIAIARDAAFGFSYDHQIADWVEQGAEIETFSPLNDEAPNDAELIILPGGYPELHAGVLADRVNFKDQMRIAAQNTIIYGECGGYMTLGQGLIDAQGQRHEMLGLLPLETSFQDRKLHLGYRELTALDGPMTGHYRGHEFHYATTLLAEGQPLFEARDAEGTALPAMGLKRDRVCGSFAHIIDSVLP